ncbi:hypothetical protein D3C81_1987180 [compost metagenome]
MVNRAPVISEVDVGSQIEGARLAQDPLLPLVVLRARILSVENVPELQTQCCVLQGFPRNGCIDDGVGGKLVRVRDVGIASIDIAQTRPCIQVLRNRFIQPEVCSAARYINRSIAAA